MYDNKKQGWLTFDERMASLYEDVAVHFKEQKMQAAALHCTYMALLARSFMRVPRQLDPESRIYKKPVTSDELERTHLLMLASIMKAQLETYNDQQTGDMATAHMAYQQGQITMRTVHDVLPLLVHYTFEVRATPLIGNDNKPHATARKQRQWQGYRERVIGLVGQYYPAPVMH